MKMKPKEEFLRCEFCNEQIPYSSPPSLDSYKKGEIHIRDGAVLLAKPNGLNHAGDLQGYYCNVECFYNHVRAIRER